MDSWYLLLSLEPMLSALTALIDAFSEVRLACIHNCHDKLTV
jgi:hypothetical protein